MYPLKSSLFFASAADFADLFTPADDPQTRYQQAGKVLYLRHLGPDCLDLLDNAKAMVEVNEFEDPHYHIADNKLG